MTVTAQEALDLVKHALSRGELLLVIGQCKVMYHGRAASKLSEGDRVLMIKHDGTFLVHQGAGMKAINYQGPGSTTRVELDAEGKLVLTSERTKPMKESIVVTFTSLSFVHACALKDDSKLKLFGTEKELADLLMQDLSVIEKGLKPLQQESSTRRGPMDILAEDSLGHLVVIEVKRRSAGLDAVTQLHRYVEEMAKRKGVHTRGILCSPEITPNALTMLQNWGLEYQKLNYEISNPSAKIKGLEKKQHTLGEF